MHYQKLDMDCLIATTPLPQFIIDHKFGFLFDYYNSIPEGKCFKSIDFEIKLLQKIYGFAGRKSKICVCSFGTHLNFLV